MHIARFPLGVREGTVPVPTATLLVSATRTARYIEAKDWEGLRKFLDLIGVPPRYRSLAVRQLAMGACFQRPVDVFAAETAFRPFDEPDGISPSLRGVPWRAFWHLAGYELIASPRPTGWLRRKLLTRWAWAQMPPVHRLPSPWPDHKEALARLSQIACFLASFSAFGEAEEIILMGRSAVRQVQQNLDKTIGTAAGNEISPLLADFAQIEKEIAGLFGLLDKESLSLDLGPGPWPNAQKYRVPPAVNFMERTSRVFMEESFIPLKKVFPFHTLDWEWVDAKRRTIQLRLKALGWRRGQAITREVLSEVLMDLARDESSESLASVCLVSPAGRYLITNGHHRLAAIVTLVADGYLPESVLGGLPCIITRVEGGDEEHLIAFRQQAISHDFSWANVLAPHGRSVELVRRIRADSPISRLGEGP